jgi:hypothetical protein
MKTSTILSLPILAASAVTAQTDPAESAPFLLKIANSANESLNGQYLYSCHAGAAIEGLCLSPSINSSYTLNTTNDLPYGTLIWKLPVNINDTVQDVPSPLSLSYLPNSNVAIPLLSPGSYGNVDLGFSDEDKLYLHTSIDDTKAVAGTSVPDGYYGDFRLSNWYACYAVVGGYYYHALAWVTSGTPSNPTCEAIEVVKEDA